MAAVCGAVAGCANPSVPPRCATHHCSHAHRCSHTTAAQAPHTPAHPHLRGRAPPAQCRPPPRAAGPRRPPTTPPGRWATQAAWPLQAAPPQWQPRACRAAQLRAGAHWQGEARSRARGWRAPAARSWARAARPRAPPCPAQRVRVCGRAGVRALRRMRAWPGAVPQAPAVLPGPRCCPPTWIGYTASAGCGSRAAVQAGVCRRWRRAAAAHLGPHACTSCHAVMKSCRATGGTQR